MNVGNASCDQEQRRPPRGRRGSGSRRPSTGRRRCGRRRLLTPGADAGPVARAARAWRSSAWPDQPLLPRDGGAREAPTVPRAGGIMASGSRTRQPAEIWSTAAATCSCSSGVSGAEPAAVAAASWPACRADVRHERLHEVGLRLVGVLQADDVVRDQRDRIDAGLGRVRSSVERQVELVATLDPSRHLDGLGRGLRAAASTNSSPTWISADAEVDDLRRVGVADRALAGRDRGDDTAGALGALTTEARRPLLRRPPRSRRRGRRRAR